MTTIVFLVLYVLGCGGALRKPLIGVITYLLIYFTYPVMAWWSKPVAWMGIRYAFVAGIFTAIGLLLNWPRLRSRSRTWHLQEALMVVLLGTMWISLFTGAEPSETSYKQLDKMTKVVIFVLMMTHIVTDLRAYRAMIWTIIIGTFYLGYQSFTAGPNAFIDGRLNNIGGPDYDRAPELGVHFVGMLPFIGAMFLTDQRWYARIFLGITTALTFNGIVLTRTRSAMTAIIAGIGWAIAKIPKRRRTRAVAVGLMGIVGAYSLTDQKFWDRMATIPAAYKEQSAISTDKNAITAMHLGEYGVVPIGRIPTWKAAWAMWKQNPLGVGIGNFSGQIQYYPPVYFQIDAHNTIVLCFAELGIPGITAFLAILLGVYLQIRRVKRVVSATPHLQWLTMDVFALETSIIMFMVGGLTVSRLYCEMMWCLLAMPICLERAVAHELRQPVRKRKRRLGTAKGNLAWQAAAKNALGATYAGSFALARRALHPTSPSRPVALVGGSQRSSNISMDTVETIYGVASRSTEATPRNDARGPRAGVGKTKGKVVEVAAGRHHTVALRSDQTVCCWGSNSDGQLGDGTYEWRSAPVQVAGLSGVVAIAAGGFHTLALHTDGTVWAWGDNLFGQLGDETQEDRTTPVRVRGLSGVVAVSAGTYASFAVRSDGTGWVWGDCRLPGETDAEDQRRPVQILGLADLDWVSGDESRTFALRSDGSVWGWGSNGSGELGNGTTEGGLAPVQAKGLSDVIAVVHEDDYAVAIQSDGSAWAWGPNRRGRLGDGASGAPSTPTRVADLADVTDVDAGNWHTVALRSDGTVWAWGMNDDGQIGDGTTQHRPTPIQVPGLSDVTAVAAGQTYSVALQSDGSVWVWGTNAGLDDEAEEIHYSPVQVVGPEEIASRQ